LLDAVMDSYFGLPVQDLSGVNRMAMRLALLVALACPLNALSTFAIWEAVRAV